MAVPGYSVSAVYTQGASTDQGGANAAISSYGYTYCLDFGRFTQRDRIGLAGGVNMFGYLGEAGEFIGPE
jgi:hypothetical protein